jgi:GT2 family glycosyltransferase
MMLMASFTVAIPTHDRRDTVVLAARSILAQEHGPEQLIVLCDGCTDGTQDALRALRDPRLEVLDLPKGPGYAYDHRNRALERATGEAIVYVGDDDLLLPDHLARVAAVWGDAVDVVTTPAAIVDPDDGLLWIGADWRVPAARERMRTDNTNVMAGVAVRVATARAAGGWDGAVARGGDWDLWRRVLDAGARPAATTAATVLQFKATGRTQAWPDRVEQNARWLATLEDRVALAALRPRLAHLRAEREALLWAEVAQLRGDLTREADAHARFAQHADATAAHAAALEAESALLHAERDRLTADNATLRADVDRLLAEHGDRGREIDALQAEIAALAADRDGARATLAAIYAGRWWRLRDRLRRG